MRSQNGHLWQGRYFSSALDTNYLLNAVRYVELNPVRAQMVYHAEDFAWSSAAAHCGIRDDLVVDRRRISPVLAAITDWSRWLAEGVAEESLATLRRNGSQNLPCGGEEFVTSLEDQSGRDLKFRMHGGSRR
jgi:putative transposase